MENKKTYSERLNDDRWRAKRLEILNRDNFECKKCSDQDAQLHVHHKRYIKGHEPWEYDNFDLITLCDLCHLEIEGILKDLNMLNINNVYIHKSTKWNTGNKIMFIRFPHNFRISIYDKNNNHIAGFTFDSNEANVISEIIKIF